MAQRTGNERAVVTNYPTGYPKVFWAALALGWLVMAIGVRGLLANADSRMATRPVGWLVVFIASNLVHDFVLVPVVLIVAGVAARLPLSRAVRRPLQFALVCSGVVVLFAFPFVRGYGQNRGNRSVLPQDYTRGTLIVLAFIWAVATVWAIRARSHDSGLRSAQPPAHRVLP